MGFCGSALGFIYAGALMLSILSGWWWWLVVYRRRRRFNIGCRIFLMCGECVCVCWCFGRKINSELSDAVWTTTTHFRFICECVSWVRRRAECKHTAGFYDVIPLVFMEEVCGGSASSYGRLQIYMYMDMVHAYWVPILWAVWWAVCLACCCVYDVFIVLWCRSGRKLSVG